MNKDLKAWLNDMHTAKEKPIDDEGCGAEEEHYEYHKEYDS